MTNEEIKKAWATLKKAMVKKDDGLNGSFRMTKNQIENRTATIMLTCDKEYDYFTEENHYSKGQVAYKKSRKEKFGSVENEVKSLSEMITTSKEFKEFQKLTGCTYHIELTKLNSVMNAYYLRINY